MKFKILILTLISFFFWILIRKHDELIRIPKEERKIVFASKDKINGKVTRVLDGDSFIINNDTMIRLYGIDAPELDQICTKNVKININTDEPIERYKNIKCGENAKNELSKMILDKDVSCNIMGKDGYERLVANCIIKVFNKQTKSNTEININQKMVLTGNAVAFQQITDEYLEDENEAKLLNNGIWSTTFDLPYIYRKNKEKIHIK